MKNLYILLVLFTINNLNAQTFTKIVYNTSNSGLPHNHVRSISIDSNDIIWIGTQQGGLARFDGVNWNSWNTSNSDIPGNNVRLVESMNNGEVWVSCIISSNPNPYWISRYYEGGWENWTGISDGLDIPDAFDLYNNKVWLSLTNGLYVYENDEFSHFDPNNNCIPPTSVSDILFITPDKYWVALSDYSIAGDKDHGLLKVEQNTCTHYDMNNSGFPSDNVTLDLRRDKDNSDKVWMRTNAGIVSFDGIDWEIFSAPGTSLPTAYAIDSVGDIWTYYNFHGFQKYDGTWHSYQNYVNDEINDISVDAQNNLWIGTSNSGLIQLQRILVSADDPLSEMQIKCYPTLVRHELFVEKADAQEITFTLTDMNNRIVLQEKTAHYKTTISMTEHTILPGLYFYYIKNINNDILQTGKLIKTE